MTLWERHVQHWSVCKACPLHATAENYVLGRGSLPCDILFLGEAPGKTEDACGSPFVGQAGRLLDAAMKAAGASRFRFFITNTVACRPCDAKDGPNRPPRWTEETAACRDRVHEVIGMARPRLIVALGGTAGAWIDLAPFPLGGIAAILKLPHPAWILRQGGESSEEYAKFVKALNRAVESIIPF